MNWPSFFTGIGVAGFIGVLVAFFLASRASETTKEREERFRGEMRDTWRDNLAVQERQAGALETIAGLIGGAEER